MRDQYLETVTAAVMSSRTAAMHIVSAKVVLITGLTSKRVFAERAV
jgi:hypothetical protein